MKRLNKKNIKKFFIAVSTPLYLVTAYFVVTESFAVLLEVFNDDFWRVLTAF